jgi:hypothetical protein
LSLLSTQSREKHTAKPVHSGKHVAVLKSFSQCFRLVYLQTGQNSIAPESSLPQLGQVRWGSFFMGLTALQPQSEPKAIPRSTEWCQIGQRRPLANCCPVPQAIPCSFILARQITFRNKIPTVGVLRRPVLITTFGDGAQFEINSRKTSTFEVAVTRVVSQTLAGGVALTLSKQSLFGRTVQAVSIIELVAHTYPRELSEQIWALWIRGK